MAASELYSKFARVWLPDAAEVWKSAELVRDYTPGDQSLSLQLEDGTLVEHSLDPQAKDLPPLRNPNILVGENDLTSLSYLHEPAVLHNLKVRFIDSKLIYTYCGIVLVAINPYESLPIYEADIIHAYSGQNMGDMDPHIFAVAEEAYKQMARDERNQSIIVSGESGAGKTVSAKYAMRYFATVSCSSGEATVEERVLASNPIMEAFGNAKTTRNDNSSRFGKYIEIGFDRKYSITGANMRTYLLEKSRVVFQAQEERNYHIFYQLCASSHLSEFKSFKLGDADDFHYTNQGQNPVIEGVDDAKELVNTRKAFLMLGIDRAHQMAIYQILAALLHLSNVEIKEESADRSSIVPNNGHLEVFCELLGVSCEEMAHWLCHRKLKTTTETFVKSLSKINAVNGRDALAKHIYARLFCWIVDNVNNMLKSTAKQHSFIGVLDIYGFETFEINSFEQFCINYANEKLQQQFNLHVFKLEQEEYMREEIPWTLIDFYDNQPCIDLIESKLGILDLLDEECKMPKGSDDSWAQKMYNTLQKQNTQFEKPRLSNRAFIIHHFADKVEYQCVGFLEKNKDTVNEEQISVLKKSQFGMLLRLFENDEKVAGAAKKPSRPGQRETKKTVGLQFRQSLHLLMDTLNATTPHYVRCIKPNDRKSPFMLDPFRAVQQLRACGILETVRISAAGFPSRWTYQEFFIRYRVLMKQKDILPNWKQTCKNLLEKCIQDKNKYQFGKSKIFFRAGQVAYLEKLRFDKLRQACVRIQKTIRCWVARKKYLKMREAAVMIQKHVRGYQARCFAMFLRRTRAAVVIQQYVRMWLNRRKYLRMLSATITIQSFLRAYMARQNYYKKIYERTAVIIQRWVRGYLEKKRYKRTLAAVILLQSCVRRMKARRELRKLKTEARSVEHFKKLNVGMENKIMQLQHKINEQHKENRELSERLNALERTQALEKEKKNKDFENLRRSEEETRAKAESVPNLLEQLSFLHEQLENTQREKKLIEEQANLYMEQTKKVVKDLNIKNDDLTKENVGMQKLIFEQAQKLAEINANFGDKKQLEMDLSEERTRYQNLLSEHLELEEKHRDLRDEMSSMGVPKFNDKIKRTDSFYSSNSSEFSQSLGSTDNEDNASHTESESPVDLPLMVKLQRRVKELELEKQSLSHQLENREETVQLVEEEKTAGRAELDLETLKRQELEYENKKLKQDLNQLRKSLTSENQDLMPPAPGSTPYNILLDQLTSSTEELEMRKEEVLLLRSHMVRQEALKHKDSELCDSVKLNLTEMPSLQHPDRSKNIHTLNEDGELWLAYEGLKETNRLLECQMREQERTHSEECKRLREELSKLKEDRAEQQKFLAQSLQLPEAARIDAGLKHEITQLTNENLELMEEQDRQDKMIRKLRKQVKFYMKKVEEYEASAQQKERASTVTPPAVNAHITRKEKEYQGMLKYKQGDENRLLKNLVTDLKPRGVAVSLIPGLPAYIIFMCLRYADNVNNDQRVTALLNTTISSIKGVIKKKGSDFEMVSFWLANVCRLLHCFKQYSGEAIYSEQNTPKQNEHCLSNFELSEYQQVFEDLAIQIYRQLIKCMEDMMQPLIVSSMLEQENMQGVLGSKPTGLRKKSSSFPEDGTATMEALLQRLSFFYSTMSQHGMDPPLTKQVVRQQFYIICAITLNHLLLRKDMCSWSKGLQIRYNVWQLEEWLTERDMADSGAKEMLEPLVQAAQLLQIKKKTEADAQAICSMCTELSPAQIMKILTLYTPIIEFEERVCTTFIDHIKNFLKDRDKSPTLMMDTKKIFNVMIRFTASSVAFDTIQIPTSLNLGFLTRI